MAKTLYCWRCKTDVPMLDAHEWAQLAPDLTDAIQQIKDYRKTSGLSLAEAQRKGFGQAALDRYFAITGHRETHPDNLWHHRVDRFGPPCTACGKPLRTSRAKLCAECGASVTGAAAS